MKLLCLLSLLFSAIYLIYCGSSTSNTYGASCTIDTVIPTAGVGMCGSSNGNTYASASVYCQFTNVDAVFGFNGEAANAQKPNYVCCPCTSDCDCDIGYYCQTNGNIQTNLYTCVQFPSTGSPLGEACSNQAVNELPARNADLDTINDPYAINLGCSIFANYTPTNGQNTQSIIWKGYCMQGVCAVCNGLLGVTSDCSTCTPRYCDTGLTRGPVRTCSRSNKWSKL